MKALLLNKMHLMPSYDNYQVVEVIEIRGEDAAISTGVGGGIIVPLSRLFNVPELKPLEVAKPVQEIEIDPTLS